MKDNFEARYYEAASFWGEGALTDEPNNKRIATTIDLVPSDVKSVLDVGCGNGIFGHELRERRPNLRVVGVDRSSEALRHVKFDVVQSAADRLPFENDEFDCVTCLQVIEHLDVELFDRVLSEIVRVAKRHAIISVPFEEQIGENVTQCPSCKTTFNVDLHMRSFDQASLNRLLEDRGGRLERIEFPMAGRRKKYLGALKNLCLPRNIDRGFLSPICPLCGYTEGDRTVNTVNLMSSNKPRSFLKSVAKRGASIVYPVWPTEYVRGYWAVCHYALRKHGRNESVDGH